MPTILRLQCQAHCCHGARLVATSRQPVVFRGSTGKSVDLGDWAVDSSTGRWTCRLGGSTGAKPGQNLVKNRQVK